MPFLSDMVDLKLKFWPQLSPKPVHKDNYFTLIFSSNLVKAAVWELTDNKAEIFAITSQSFTGDLEENYLNTVNVVISVLEEKITGVRNIVFGVPFEWVEEGAIKDNYQSLLKKISGELELKPAGFVMIPDALNYYLEKENGVPLTAIMVEVQSEEIIVSLIKIGKTRIVIARKIDKNYAETLASVLKEFSLQDVLPSNIFIYGQADNLEDIKQELISFPWLSKVDLLHFPKIDIMPKDLDVLAVTYASLSEIVQTKKVQVILRENENGAIKTPEKLHEIAEEAVTSSTEGAKKETPLKPAALSDLEMEDETGFVHNADILAEKDDFEEEENSSFDLDNELTSKEVQQQQETQEGKKLPKIKFPKIRLTFTKNSIFSQLRDWFKIPTRFKLLGFFGITLVIMILSLVAVYWNILHAEVTLVVQPKLIEKNAEIIASPQASLIDDLKRIIPARYYEAYEKGKLTIPASGVKTVGEKASGEVVIYNKTSSGKAFTSGMVLTADGLKFTLDKDASVAAQTVNETAGGATITYGRQKVAIKAVSFGSKYNLSQNTSFKIDDFPVSSYEAKNDQALSGGSSRDITVVSEEDQDTALKNLTKNLIETAKKETFVKVAQNKKIIEPTIETTVAKKQFSSAIDSEVKDLTLDAELKFKALFYDDSDIKSLMAKAIQSEIPDDYKYVPEYSQDKVEVKKTNKDQTVTLQINFQTKLLPKIDTEEIQKGLTGKSLKAGKSYLGLFKNIQAHEVNIKPGLPGFLLSFPRVSQNIKVDIVTK